MLTYVCQLWLIVLQSALVSDYLRHLRRSGGIGNYQISFHYYLTPHLLQNLLEIPLERKAGKVFAPKQFEKLYYHCEDINASQRDE